VAATAQARPRHCRRKHGHLEGANQAANRVNNPMTNRTPINNSRTAQQRERRDQGVRQQLKSRNFRGEHIAWPTFNPPAARNTPPRPSRSTNTTRSIIARHGFEHRALHLRNRLRVRRIDASASSYRRSCRQRSRRARRYRSRLQDKTARGRHNTCRDLSHEAAELRGHARLDAEIADRIAENEIVPRADESKLGRKRLAIARNP